MTDIAALKALLEKVKAGFDRPTNWRDFAELEKPFRATDEESRAILAHRAFYGDVNAAIAFHKAVRPGYDVDLEIRLVLSDATIYHPSGDGRYWVGTDEVPARALLIADIESIIAEGE